ncbi:MAG: DUF2764 family protein [Proteiniphilum sp.]|nr:DUF2764 family protein [Proteiniphilum sp.]
MLFKNQYYYFISGLPDFTFDSMKLPLTVDEFKVMLDEELKPEDRKLLSNYFLRYDNDNLFNLLKDRDAALNSTGNLSLEEMQDAIEKVKEGDTIENKQIPPYYEASIKAWLNDEVQDESRTLEDLISSFYMDYGLEAKNSLIAGWFELNLNIGNILSAIYARKYEMDVTKVIVGNNKLAMIIRENANARDFGITLELDYFDAIQRLSEESDIYERERKLDKFRWDWLEQNTTLDYFNIEYIFAYLCKLQILERWVSLNAEEGERVFRELISGLKNEIEMPDEL